MPELEHALRQLGRELDWPATPHLASAVSARLERRPPRWRPVALAFASIAAALAVAMAVSPARSAILDFFRIGGVEIRTVETVPDLPPERAAPGDEVTLAEARDAVAFDLVVPDGYDAVHLEGGIVTFVFPDRLLMQFSGDEPFLKKVTEQDSAVDWVDVKGYPGVWIDAPHGLFLPGGEARLAGNVLIWVREGVTFRLEGDLSRERALELAGTLTP
jgi:hypothetical protein